jgi:hypothetical protein
MIHRLGQHRHPRHKAKGCAEIGEDEATGDRIAARIVRPQRMRSKQRRARGLIEFFDHRPALTPCRDA